MQKDPSIKTRGARLELYEFDEQGNFLNKVITYTEGPKPELHTDKKPDQRLNNPVFDRRAGAWKEKVLADKKK